MADSGNNWLIIVSFQNFLGKDRLKSLILLVPDKFAGIKIPTVISFCYNKKIEFISLSNQYFIFFSSQLSLKQGTYQIPIKRYFFKA